MVQNTDPGLFCCSAGRLEIQVQISVEKNKKACETRENNFVCCTILLLHLMSLSIFLLVENEKLSLMQKNVHILLSTYL